MRGKPGALCGPTVVVLAAPGPTAKAPHQKVGQCLTDAPVWAPVGAGDAALRAWVSKELPMACMDVEQPGH